MTKTSEIFPLRFYVYVLFSLRDRGLYIGYSTDLRNRFSQHSRGEVKSTANRRPLKLIHYEFFIYKNDAKAREVYLKSGYGREQLRASMKQTFAELKVR